MAMMAYEMCIQTVDSYVKQLEGLAFTKNASLAARLTGAIDAVIMVAGVSSDTWNRRVQSALADVMKERPSMVKMENTLPEEIVAGAKNPAPGTPAAVGTVKLPVI
jgi:TRAP-type uncharacterized transport system substrate-binding protein